MLTSMILSSRWVHFLRQPIAALLKQLIGLHDVSCMLLWELLTIRPT